MTNGYTKRAVSHNRILLFNRGRVSLVCPTTNLLKHLEYWTVLPIQNRLHNEFDLPASISQKHSCQFHSLVTVPKALSVSCLDSCALTLHGPRPNFGCQALACVISILSSPQVVNTEPQTGPTKSRSLSHANTNTKQLFFLKAKHQKRK